MPDVPPAAHPGLHPAAAPAVLDPERVAAVRRTGLLDTAADDAFDRFTRLAARLLGVSHALVTLVDDRRQFCKSAHGLPAPADPAAPMPSLPFSHSFCQHVVAGNRPLVLDDARTDPVHRANAAIADFGAVAYAGVPLADPGGAVVGTLCAVHGAPRAWSADDVLLLVDLAAGVGAELALRRALSESEEARRLAQLLLAASPDSFLAVDAEGRCTYASDRALGRVGRPAAEVLGRPVFDLLPAGERDGVAGLLARVQATGAPLQAEVRATTPGMPGGRWLALHATPNGAGGAAVALRDVTARHDAEAALRASEARFRALAESANDAIVTADSAGRIAYWNAGAERMFGHSTAEAVGQSLGIIVPPAYRARHDAGLARVAAGAPSRLAGQVLQLEGCRRSGEVFPLELSMTHYAVDGAAYFTSIMRDATDRRRAEAELRASEARYRAVVEQSPEPVVLHRAGRVVYVNPSGARLVGAEAPDALVGVSLFDLLHPDDHDAARRNMACVMAGAPRDAATHYRLLRRDGTAVDVESVSALVDVDGEPAVQTLLRDVTERNRLERALTHQAFHDPLTGLANRALFLDRLGLALARRASGREAGGDDEVAVVYLDLDDFKTVNDSLGHAHGDALLREVARRLQRATRGCDTVARLGGDEFAVLLDRMGGPGDAAVVVGRVAQALAAPVPLGEGAAAAAVRAGASVGVAHARGGDTAEGLLRDADIAMYRAKTAGKGRHAVFEPAMHAALVARVRLEADLRAALAAPGASGLWVAYQPIVDVATGAVRAFEALARWDRAMPNGDTRPVPPGDFIPVAESSGLVAPLGRWVLRAACAQTAAWRRALGSGAELPRVSVNVSGRQLDDVDGLVADVRGALADAGLPASALVLEMTETVLMQRTDDTLRRLAALKALGVSLAIDDFGTGYSSLAYLQRFPVDVLKVDKAFVDGVADEEGDRAITRTVLALGDALGLRVVAEGVEREAQRRTLQAMGCASAQGYLFARPLPAAEAGALLLGGACAAPAASGPAASGPAASGPAPSAPSKPSA